MHGRLSAKRTSSSQLIATTRDYGDVRAGDRAAISRWRADGKIKSSVAEIREPRRRFVSAVIALEVLASRVDPPDTQTIAKLAAGCRPAGCASARGSRLRNEMGLQTRSIGWRAGHSISSNRHRAKCTARPSQSSATLVTSAPSKPLKRSRKQFPCIAKEADAAIGHLQVR
jgi:hypothetical protein